MCQQWFAHGKGNCKCKSAHMKIKHVCSRKRIFTIVDLECLGRVCFLGGSLQEAGKKEQGRFKRLLGCGLCGTFTTSSTSLQLCPAQPPTHPRWNLGTQNPAGTCTVRVYTLQMLPLGITPTDILYGDSRQKTTSCCLPQLCCLPLCIADIRIIRTATRQPFLVFQRTKVLSEVAGKF